MGLCGAISSYNTHTIEMKIIVYSFILIGKCTNHMPLYISVSKYLSSKEHEIDLNFKIPIRNKDFSFVKKYFAFHDMNWTLVYCVLETMRFGLSTFIFCVLSLHETRLNVFESLIVR